MLRRRATDNMTRRQLTLQSSRSEFVTNPDAICPRVQQNVENLAASKRVWRGIADDIVVFNIIDKSSDGESSVAWSKLHLRARSEVSILVLFSENFRPPEAAALVASLHAQHDVAAIGEREVMGNAALQSPFRGVGRVGARAIDCKAAARRRRERAARCWRKG